MGKKRSLNLDILRGVAALTVVFHHLFVWAKAFDKNYWYWNYISYEFPGHLALLLFFILSGYVIGLNHSLMSNKTMVTEYIKKRLIRLTPIYFIAVLFCIMISWGQYSRSTMLSNLFFMSVPFDNVMPEGNPLWSLNYELLYYILFIPLVYFNISFVKTVRISFLITLALILFFYRTKVPPLLISYLIGFIFWISGAWIAKIAPTGHNPISGARIIAVIILIFSIGTFNPCYAILNSIHITGADYSGYSWYQQSMNYNDLFYYPFALFLLLILTHNYNKKYHLLAWFTFLASFAHFGYKYKSHFLNLKPGPEHFVIPSILLAIASLLWIINFQVPERLKSALRSTAGLSRISYAIYVIHMPILFIFGQLYAGSGAGYALKILLYLLAVMAVSYFLEEKYQPAIKKILTRKSFRSSK